MWSSACVRNFGLTLSTLEAAPASCDRSRAGDVCAACKALAGIPHRFPPARPSTASPGPAGCCAGCESTRLCSQPGIRSIVCVSPRCSSLRGRPSRTCRCPAVGPRPANNYFARLSLPSSRVQGAVDERMRTLSVVVAVLLAGVAHGFVFSCPRSHTSPVRRGVRRGSTVPFSPPIAVRPHGIALRADTDEGKYESYEGSGGAVKAIVGALTALVNAVMRRDDEIEGGINLEDRSPLSLDELRGGIVGDYERCYLWTGDIDPLLYDAQCTFTDPTLSFQGLQTFQKNLANLRPIIDRFVTDYSVILYSCEIDEACTEVVARWRMIGTVGFPWRPKIDLIGKTRFKYASDKGNRIVAYLETWETPAAQVLLNLLKPGAE